MRREGDTLLRTLLQRGIAAGRFSAAAARYTGSNGKIVEEVAGRLSGDPEADPVGSESLFDLASLTKPLATATLLQLAEEDGRLDLDGPVEPWLPELTGGPYGGVTVTELAHHRAGLPAWCALAAIPGGPEAWLPIIGRLEPAVARGKTLYSDVGFLLLGMLLQRLHGCGLARLFEERIVRNDPPLGVGFALQADPAAVRTATAEGNAFERRLAGSTHFPLRETIAAGEVHDTHAWALGGEAGHAGLFGDLRSVTELGCRLLPGGSLATTRRSLDRRFGGRLHEERSFGWQRAASCGAVRGILPGRCVGHLGFTGTSIWLDPEKGTVITLLTNRVHPRVPVTGFQPFRRAVHRIVLGAG